MEGEKDKKKKVMSEQTWSRRPAKVELLAEPGLECGPGLWPLASPPPGRRTMSRYPGIKTTEASIINNTLASILTFTGYNVH